MGGIATILLSIGLVSSSRGKHTKIDSTTHHLLNATNSALQSLYEVEINNLGNSNLNKRKEETSMLDFQGGSDSAIIQSDKSTPKGKKRRPADSNKLEASLRSRCCLSDVRKSTKKMCPVTVKSDKSTPKRKNRRPADSNMLEASPRSRRCLSDVRKSTKKMCPVTVNFFSAAFSVPKVKAP